MADEMQIEILKKQGMTEEEAKEFMAGVHRGIADYKAGKVYSWEDTKAMLGIVEYEIHLCIDEPREFKVGDVIHLKVVEREDVYPGHRWLQVEDVTPLPGVSIAYICFNCGLTEDVEKDGSLPKGWLSKKFAKGTRFLCSECKGTQVCRVCGCTDNRACVRRSIRYRCTWVEPDLCSACVDKEGVTK